MRCARANVSCRNERRVPPRITDAVVFDQAEIGLAPEYIANGIVVFEAEHAGDVVRGIAGDEQFKATFHARGVGVGHERALRAVVIVAEGRARAAGPVALLEAAEHAHARALADGFAFELRKHGHHPQHGLAGGRGGVKVFVERCKGDVVGVENILDQVERVLLAAREAVQFVDQYMRDPPLAYVADEVLHGGALDIAAGKPGVDVALVFLDALGLAVGLEHLLLLLDGVALFELRVGGYAHVQRRAGSPLPRGRAIPGHVVSLLFLRRSARGQPRLDLRDDFVEALRDGDGVLQGLFGDGPAVDGHGDLPAQGIALPFPFCFQCWRCGRIYTD